MDLDLSTPSWDDQGLWFALLFNTVVGIILCGVSVFLLLTPVLWIRRLYRTNHTVLSPSTPPNQGSSSHTSAVKRIGLALCYPCSLFTLPSWFDWVSVEEDVPHLESIFEPSARTLSSDENVNGGQERPGAVPNAPVTNVMAGPSPPQQRIVKNSSKTPLDPQVALYLYFLKLSASIFIIGACFTVWTCALSGTDHYVEHYMVQRDIYHCRQHASNETQCVAKAPYCQYIKNFGCAPVPLRGLYDLSAQNITPRSWRLWLVSLFDMGFCVAYIIFIIIFLYRVDTYIAEVMELQMERALGHRVVIVRGLRNGETFTEDTFKERFLSESAYFRPHQQSRSDADAKSKAADDDDVHYQCDCTGLNCLFSVVGFNYYMTTRANAIFTQECHLNQLLFPRSPPSRMYSYMEKTENAMKALQEALADEKAHLRRLEEKRGSGEMNNDSQETDKAVLMMRKSFPSCCSKVPKVEYCKQAFVKHAAHLNKAIDEVSKSQSKGSAVVVFRHPLAAYEFVNLFEWKHGIKSNCRATIAGPPGQIVQVNMTANRYIVWLRTVVVFFVFVLLVFFWSVPVGFLGSLDNIARVPGIGESFAKFYSHVPETVRGIITAFLPVLVLALFNIALPYIMRIFVIAMGAINEAECNGGILYLQYLFMLLTGVIFQAALQGGLAQLGDLIADPSGESIINFFVAVVSPRGGYWYAKILSDAFISTWIDLIDPLALIMAVLRRKSVSVQRVYDGLFRPCLPEWSQLYSSDLTIIAMGLLFRMTAPLLTLFVGVYFIVRYMTQRCRLYDRYRPSIYPKEDCTNFSASVQAIRAVSWLYCLGSTGGVLFMSLRNHVGGVVCCSFTLAAGILLLVHVHMVTRRWVASLAHARKFFGNLATSSTLYGTGSELSSDVSDVPCQRETNGLERPLMEGRKKRHTNTELRLSPVTPSVVLLPQRECVESLYQPRHQRLLPIDTTQEIERFEHTTFHVDRYWDGLFGMVAEINVYKEGLNGEGC